MCGIAALIGIDSFKILLESLKQLQNRGYDSAGICTINNNNFNINKYASEHNKTALEKLEKNINQHKGCINGIAHTRWATHGPKNDINSHPHISMNNLFSIVHNGIIENYSSLKKDLINNGYKFKSETDTEVIVNLLEYEYSLLQNEEISDELIIKVIRNTISKLQGTWGLAIQFLKIQNSLYCTRQGSPILISNNNNFAMITSEQSGFCGYSENYIILDNNDVCCLKKEKSSIKIITDNSYTDNTINSNIDSLTPEPYPHWTIKEIHEQIDSSLRAISLGGRLLSTDKVKLGGLEPKKRLLGDIDNLILLGCGTSYFAGLLGINFLKDLCDFNVVQVFDGAEFTKKDIPKIGKTALLLMSQSGETKDLHRCINIGKENNLFLIGLINVPDSMIARESYCGCYLNAGREVAVASTKSFTSQVILLSMIAIWFAQIKDINHGKRVEYIKDLRKLYLDFETTIQTSKKKVEEYLHILKNRNSCFILGKGNGEAIAKEGSLKIKELTYMHAEGYSSSSLKHGPFSLLDKDFPVIIIAPENENYSKLENAYEEIKSRYGKIIFITDKKNCEKENVIQIPKNKTFGELISVIPLQLFAYKLAIAKGINPDMPKNLAKVVTVE